MRGLMVASGELVAVGLVGAVGGFFTFLTALFTRGTRAEGRRVDEVAQAFEDRGKLVESQEQRIDHLERDRDDWKRSEQECRVRLNIVEGEMGVLRLQVAELRGHHGEV